MLKHFGPWIWEGRAQLLRGCRTLWFLLRFSDLRPIYTLSIIKCAPKGGGAMAVTGWDMAGRCCLGALVAVLGDRAVTRGRSTNCSCSGLTAPLERCHRHPGMCGCPGMCPAVQHSTGSAPSQLQGLPRFIQSHQDLKRALATDTSSPGSAQSELPNPGLIPEGFTGSCGASGSGRCCWLWRLRVAGTEG